MGDNQTDNEPNDYIEIALEIINHVTTSKNVNDMLSRCEEWGGDRDKNLRHSVCAALANATRRSSQNLWSKYIKAHRITGFFADPLREGAHLMNVQAKCDWMRSLCCVEAVYGDVAKTRNEQKYIRDMEWDDTSVIMCSYVQTDDGRISEELARATRQCTQDRDGRCLFWIDKLAINNALGLGVGTKWIWDKILSSLRTWMGWEEPLFNKPADWWAQVAPRFYSTFPVLGAPPRYAKGIYEAKLHAAVIPEANDFMETIYVAWSHLKTCGRCRRIWESMLLERLKCCRRVEGDAPEGLAGILHESLEFLLQMEGDDLLRALRDDPVDLRWVGRPWPRAEAILSIFGRGYFLVDADLEALNMTLLLGSTILSYNSFLYYFVAAKEVQLGLANISELNYLRYRLVLQHLQQCPEFGSLMEDRLSIQQQVGDSIQIGDLYDLLRQNAEIAVAARPTSRTGLWRRAFHQALLAEDFQRWTQGEAMVLWVVSNLEHLGAPWHATRAIRGIKNLTITKENMYDPANAIEWQLSMWRNVLETKSRPVGPLRAWQENPKDALIFLSNLPEAVCLPPIREDLFDLCKGGSNESTYNRFETILSCRSKKYCAIGIFTMKDHDIAWEFFCKKYELDPQSLKDQLNRALLSRSSGVADCSLYRMPEKWDSSSKLNEVEKSDFCGECVNLKKETCKGILIWWNSTERKKAGSGWFLQESGSEHYKLRFVLALDYRGGSCSVCGKEEKVISVSSFGKSMWIATRPHTWTTATKS